MPHISTALYVSLLTTHNLPIQPCFLLRPQLPVRI
jgi:hypothetical protein